MRALVPLALLTCSSAGAQIVNGSFETSGTASLAGWEWTCSDPMLGADAAPGAGQWSAAKESGQTQGCFPSYLYQRLAGVSDGQQLILSGWVRCGDMPPCPGAYFGLGTVNSGIFHLEETVGSNQSDWSFHTLTDTVELQTGDTAILVLNSGLVGGPISPNPGFFDGLAVETVLGLSEHEEALLAQYRAGDELFLAVRQGRIMQTRVLDLTGREVHAIVQRDAAQCRIALESLGSGVYFADVRTDRGEQTVRFLVE